MTKSVRGISEIVSASLLAIIVVIAGIFVALRIMELTASSTQIVQEEAIEQKASLRQALSILTARITSDETLSVYVITGDYPVGIDAVYVNGSLLDCNISWSDITAKRLDGHGHIVVPYYTIALITCKLPSSTTFVKVKIVYDGGEVSTFARKA